MTEPRRRFGVVPRELENGGRKLMLEWALTLLIIALAAAIVGFGSIAGAAVSIAKIIFIVAIGLFALTAIAHLVRGRP
jgi:uncharacterized membrane protein YtjA (UPF0391 family)